MMSMCAAWTRGASRVILTRDTWHVGGRVWRVRPRRGNKLLVAAMNDGFKVVDIKEGKYPPGEQRS